MNNKTLLFLALTTVSVTTIHAQSLLIHYEFNNTNTLTTVASDSSGNSRNANITGWNGTAQVPTALQTAAGVSGLPGDYAFDNTAAPAMGSFDNRGGAVRWVGTPGVNMIGNLSALTISYWFKTPVGVVASNSARAVSLYGQGNDQFFENRYPSVGGVNGFASTVTTGLSLRTSPTNSFNQSDTWTFAAFTFDGNAITTERIKMYVGGIDTPVTFLGAFDSALTSINLNTNTNSLTLGGLFDGTGRTPFDAIMDDFRLYGNDGSSSESALSLAQLDAVRLSAVPEPQTVTMLLLGLAACLWKLRTRTHHL